MGGDGSRQPSDSGQQLTFHGDGGEWESVDVVVV